MGLFSSKEKVQVFAKSMPLVTEDPFPVEDAILYAVLEGLPIVDTLLASLSGGFQQRMPQMRRYAETTYTLGLPNTAISNTRSLTTEALRLLINTEFGLTYGCIVAQHFIATLKAPLILLPFLSSQRNLNFVTNEVGTPPEEMELPDIYKGHPTIKSVTIADIVINNSMTAVDITYTAVMQYSYYTPKSGDEVASWKIKSMPTEYYTTEYTETVPIASGYIMDTPYYVIGYYKLDAEGNIDGVLNWWYYAIESGKYPEMGATKEVVEESSSYPVVPIRHDNEWIADTNPDIYSTGKTMLDMVHIPIDSVQNTLQDNPSIADIDNAYIMFGIDMQTEDPKLLTYLAYFFEMLGQTSQATVWDQLRSFNSAGTVLETSNYTLNESSDEDYSQQSYTNQVFGSMDVTDLTITNPSETLSLTEHGLKIKLSWDRIITVVLSGSIGEVGTVTKEFVKHRDTWTGMGGEDSFRELVEQVPSQVIIRRQVSAGAYKQVTITNLTHGIYGLYNERWVLTTAIDDLMDDEDEHNMIIPLHHPTMMQIPNTDRNYVYSHTAHLVITGYIVTSVKWYNTGFFKFVVMVVCLAIAVYTGGQSLVALQTWIAGIATAIEVGTMAIILHIITPLLKMVLLSEIAKGLAKILGPELSMVFAFIVAAYVGFTSLDLVTKSTSLVPLVGKLNANTLLDFSMKIASEANEGLKDEYESIEEEAEDFRQQSTSAWAELEEKQETLLPNISLSNILVNVFETPHVYDKMSNPDELYSRIHVGNVGVLSLDIIENYVNMVLTLPDDSSGIT